MSDMAINQAAIDARIAQRASYRKKGIAIGIMSGLLYGAYSAFMTQGMATGIWETWYGGAVSAFALIYTLSAAGAAVNDICSAVWTIIYDIVIGRFGDFVKTINTKPGKILMFAAICGGPVATTCYVIGLQTAGSVITPIAALNVAIGAIIGRVAYKQKLTGAMIGAIALCFCASVFTGFFGYGIPEGGITAIFSGMSGKSLIGMLAALGAALGWGFEGTIGGYACCMVDYEVAICIRQCTSGLINAVVVCTMFSIIGGDGIGSGLGLVCRAFADGPSIWLFFIGGVFASWSYKFWYKSAAMCGAAMGQACNGTYSFFVPMWCLLICGIIGGADGWAIAWEGWVGAIVMVIGIFILSIAQDKATQDEINV